MSAERTIGVDVGGTKIVVGLVERDGTIARMERRPTRVESTRSVLEGIGDAVDAIRDDSVAAVGIGIPSAIDQRTGTAVFSVNIPLAGIDVRSWAAERFGLPAAIDNDANCAALAEWRAGAGRGTTDMIMITLGTGIGGGLILGGHLYRGWIGAGAELGHIVVDGNGPACQGNCTGRGHLERVASGRAVDAAAERLLGPGAGTPELVAAAREGNEAAGEAIAEAGRWLGIGIASLVSLLNPELVVIGGGFGEAFDLLIDPIREMVARDGVAPARDVVRILPAELGPDAGLIGAALVGFEALGAAGVPAARG
ncbi:MAG TPA: ROK family protein [Gaiellaceae bacterium]|nr:ROK family protein [Gaiellaceae bacterium]